MALGQPANLLANSQHDVGDSSPFLDLPPELRNRIYGLVLGGNTIHIRNIKGHKIFKIAVCDHSFGSTKHVTVSS